MVEVVLGLLVGEKDVVVALDVVVDRDLVLVEVDDQVLMEEELLNNELALVIMLLVGDDLVDEGVVDEVHALRCKHCCWSY